MEAGAGPHTRVVVHQELQVGVHLQIKAGSDLGAVEGPPLGQNHSHFEQRRTPGLWPGRWLMAECKTAGPRASGPERRPAPLSPWLINDYLKRTKTRGPVGGAPG